MIIQANFEELQTDSVSAQVQKYIKTVYQLDKGLPPNGVVPTLKFKVEAMKDMVYSILLILSMLSLLSLSMFSYP